MCSTSKLRRSHLLRLCSTDKLRQTHLLPFLQMCLFTIWGDLRAGANGSNVEGRLRDVNVKHIQASGRTADECAARPESVEGVGCKFLAMALM